MLPQKHRLPSPEIFHVMRFGTRVAGSGITVIYRIKNIELRSKNEEGRITNIEYGILNTEYDTSRFAFVVSTKVDKRAVIRNRTKRIIRESVQHVLPSLIQPIDAVVIGSRGLVGLSQSEVEEKVKESLRKVGILNTEY